MIEPKSEYNAGEGEELKPCPYCGSSNIVVSEHSQDMVWARCADCGTYGRVKSHHDIQAAKVAWNARPIEDTLRAELAAAKLEAQHYYGESRWKDGHVAHLEAELAAAEPILKLAYAERFKIADMLQLLNNYRDAVGHYPGKVTNDKPS